MKAATIGLLNATTVDALPATLLPARRNDHARQLARASWLLRCKQNGRFLATLETIGGRHWLRPLDDRAAMMQPGIEELLALLGLAPRGRLRRNAVVELRQRPAGQQSLPPASALLGPVLQMLARLGIDPLDYMQRRGLPLALEPRLLAAAGRDRYGRRLWLVAPAAAQWQAMQRAAADSGVVLEAISGFRSAAYQYGIFRRKLARGLDVAQILEVNAAPGFSEHHTGCALDIGSPDEPPAEESFEQTAAFAWLTAHAAQFGFRMSYPRDNPHGIVYEPWHWRWVGEQGG